MDGGGLARMETPQRGGAYQPWASPWDRVKWIRRGLKDRRISGAQGVPQFEANMRRSFRRLTWQWVEIEWGPPHPGKDWSSAR